MRIGAPRRRDSLTRGRERGIVVERMDAAGIGRIRADNGDNVVLFFWSVVQGFHQLVVGQRVEFTRASLGTQRNVATLVVSLEPDGD